jgi:hypothetical protein
MAKTSMASSSGPLHRFAGSSTALAFVLVVVTTVFVATHMQYWVEYPIPTYSPDSQTYLAIAFDISNGVLPVFDLRTPGYPLFLYAVLEATDSVSAVVLLQQLFTLSSAYVLCIASFLIRRSLVLVSLIPGLGIVGSQRAQMYELWILPEAIYAALLVFVFAFLLVGFVRRSRAWLMLGSCAMGMTILFRPSGLFLVGTYVLILVAFWLSGFRRDQVVSFAATLPAMLLALCSYNYATIGKFTVSPFGPANLAAATATFWPEVPGFPEPVNIAIRKSQEEVSREDREALRVEWNPWRLNDVYRRYYNKFLWFRIVPALDAAGAKGMSAQGPYLARMSQLAITQDPVSYMKFVYTSLYMLFEGMGQSDESPDQTDSYLRLYGEPRYLGNGVHPAYESQLRYLERPDLLVRFRRFALREYETAPFRRAAPAEATLLSEGRADSHERFSFWVRIAERYDRFVHTSFYVGKGWVVLLTALAIFSMFALLRVRRAETTTLAWLGLIIPLSAFGAVLLIALVEVGSARYLYPTRFLFYLAPLLMLEIYLQARSAKH